MRENGSPFLPPPADGANSDIYSVPLRSGERVTKETVKRAKGVARDGTVDTVTSGVGADDADQNLSRFAESLGEGRGEAKNGPTDEEVSVVDRVAIEAVRCLRGLRAQFSEDHGGDESDEVFCDALNGIFGVENTGGPIAMIRQVAERTADSTARQILREDEINSVEVDIAQKLSCVASFDADVRSAIGEAFAQLRDALRSVAAMAGSSGAS
ncbi:MAG: hypothetical protein QF755_04120 [Candidatus Peribacteraceae bacterium]|jgi:hypothetical protein|nr:hypothetical protein [Candidatus Peribacteraceae bacterium]|tara:strand:+ start:1291 stop:1926 length:636 start_codon:yes stop_codon:yes gene_type:complete